MKIVIDIPEYIYKSIKLNPYKFILDYSDRIADEILNGKILSRKLKEKYED